MKFTLTLRSSEDARVMKEEFDVFLKKNPKTFPKKIISMGYLYEEIDTEVSADAELLKAYETKSEPEESQFKKDLSRTDLYRVVNGVATLSTQFRGRDFVETESNYFLSDLHPKAKNIHQGVGIFPSRFIGENFAYTRATGEAIMVVPYIDSELQKSALYKDMTNFSLERVDSFESYACIGYFNNSDHLIVQTTSNKILELPIDAYSALKAGIKKDGLVSFEFEGTSYTIKPMIKASSKAKVSKEGQVSQDFTLETPLTYNGPDYSALKKTRQFSFKAIAQSALNSVKLSKKLGLPFQWLFSFLYNLFKPTIPTLPTDSWLETSKPRQSPRVPEGPAEVLLDNKPGLEAFLSYAIDCAASLEIKNDIMFLISVLDLKTTIVAGEFSLALTKFHKILEKFVMDDCPNPISIAPFTRAALLKISPVTDNLAGYFNEAVTQVKEALLLSQFYNDYLEKMMPESVKTFIGPLANVASKIKSTVSIETQTDNDEVIPTSPRKTAPHTDKKV